MRARPGLRVQIMLGMTAVTLVAILTTGYIALWAAGDNLRVQREAMAAKYRQGGFGYGDLKKSLFEHYWNYFAEARKKRAELVANPDYVNQVLSDGAVKARTLAQTVLKRARKASGLE